MARIAPKAAGRRHHLLIAALLAGIASAQATSVGAADPAPASQTSDAPYAAGTAAAAVPTAPGLADLVEVADLAGLTASPDGRAVAFRIERARLDSNDYPTDWYVADLGSGAVRRIGPGGGAIYRDPGVSPTETPVWSRDGRYLYYRALIGGVVQVWRADVRGGGARSIVQDEADVRRIRLSDDGAALLMEVGASRNAIRFAERQEYDAGILVDETVDLGQSVFRGAVINGRNATQRLTGTWFSRDGLLWETPARLRRVDLATLAVNDASEAPEPAATVPFFTQGDVFTQTFGAPNGDVATIAMNFRRNEAEMTVTRHGESEPSATCSADMCRSGYVAWAAWRPGHDALVFATQRHGIDALFIWEVATGSVRPLAELEGSLGGGRDHFSRCTITGTDAICVAAAPGAPPRLVAIGIDDGVQRTLFDPNPRLRAATLQPERLTWTGRNGHDYRGWLFVPPGASQRGPLFITYYTCDGFLRGGLGDEWPLEALARAGIAALCVEQTGVDTGDRYDGVAPYRAALEGVEAVIHLLDERGLVDPARVGMGGLSFGSEVTLWTAVHSDLLAAASVTSPSFEPAYYWLNGVRGRDNHDVLRRYWHLGAPDETPRRWRQLSPAANVDRIHAALLMQMPEQEARSSIELHARLTNSTTPVELYVFPDEPHLKFQPRHKLAVYQRNLDWFRFWLQGYIDPDPLKAAQYRRWEALTERRDAAGSR